MYLYMNIKYKYYYNCMYFYFLLIKSLTKVYTMSDIRHKNDRPHGIVKKSWYNSINITIICFCCIIKICNIYDIHLYIIKFKNRIFSN